jgi:hypothetical protein
MKTLKMESLDAGLQKTIRGARKRPLVVTDGGKPFLVIRDFLDDDLADERITLSPSFRKTVRLARRQRVLGQTKSLAELRRKYR